METGSEKKLRLFAVVLTNHRLWGPILIPYILDREGGKGYFKMTEALSPYPNSETLSTLTSDEREVIKILNEYSDRGLFKIFSKEKNVKEFLDTVPQEKIEKLIRPAIEKRIYKALTIARDENISVYYQKSRSSTLHEEDRLSLNEELARPVFRFARTIEQTTYKLSLESSGKIIDMKKSQIDIICNSPCLIRDERRILFVSDVEGTKLKPFLSRENIIIPIQTEVKYFKSFVLNAVNNYKVLVEGFEIIEALPIKKAILDIETGISGKPVLILRFNYQGNKIYATDKSTSFTFFEEEAGIFRFRKYMRDFEWEVKSRQTMNELGYFSDDEINFYPVGGESKQKEDLYRLIESVNRNYEEITEAGFEIVSRLDNKYNLQPVTIGISSQIENDWFDLKAKVKVGNLEISFNSLRKNILQGIREYILPDGSVAILPETWFARYRNLFEFGKSDGDSLKIHKQHFALLADTISETGHHGFEKLEQLLKKDQIPEIKPPEGLKCTMRQYQADGLNWLNFLQNAGLGGCLADDMGLGKTIQTIALLLHNKENFRKGAENMKAAEMVPDKKGERLTTLIIMPASLVYNWENEINRFAPGLKIFSYKGNQRKKATEYFKDYDIIISSYHTVRQDIELISTFYFHYIILDESQVIKNPASMLYRTVSRLKSDYKLVLSGTPVENSLTDLWTQLNFVNPGLLGELAFFRREYAKPIEKMGDDEKEVKLRKIIQPFILRRTKEMVASDLPPISEQTVLCDMTEEQFKLYDEEKSAVRNSLLENMESSGHEKSAILVLQGLMKLRQISNHPLLTYENYASGSGKFDTVLQDMESVISEGHKILVFSSFVRHLELYSDELNRKRIRYSILTGATINREKVVNDFQDDPENKIFLISLKAGGVGLNLTAADYVFILDPWWNPASEVQALNRAHRIGQNKSVFVYRYITGNTIEEKIVRLQEKKSKLADTFITSNNPLKDLDIHNILNIIG